MLSRKFTNFMNNLIFNENNEFFNFLPINIKFLVLPECPRVACNGVTDYFKTLYRIYLLFKAYLNQHL